jgi:hypothetical protein
VTLDAQQAQLKHLEQAAGTRTDDDDFGLDHRQARPAFESVGVW